FCLTPEFKGKTQADMLSKEIQILYENYLNAVLRQEQDETYWRILADQFTQWSQAGIEVIYVLPPYHPDFMKRMQKDNPELYRNHFKMVERLLALSLPNVRVASYLEGIPGDDGGPRYWNDGVHFTCLGAIKMLAPLL
ncbi:MAG: hypothetical protein AAGB31_12925, partial [Bdellovibrio sp.]